MQLPADRGLRKVRAAPAGQVFAQQRDRPLDRLIAEVLRPPLEGGRQGRLQLLGPQAGVIATALVGQGRRVVPLLVAGDPVVDAHAAGAEQPGDLGNRSAGGRLQDREGAPEQPRIVGLTQLLFESSAPRSGQR